MKKQKKGKKSLPVNWDTYTYLIENISKTKTELNKNPRQAEKQRLELREALRRRGEAKVRMQKGISQLTRLKQIQKNIGMQDANKRAA